MPAVSSRFVSASDRSVSVIERWSPLSCPSSAITLGRAALASGRVKIFSGSLERGAAVRGYVVNDVPQPQDFLASGLLNSKPPPMRLFLKSTVVPSR